MSPAHPRFERFERRADAVSKVFHWIGVGLFLPVLMVLVTVDVFMRYLLGGSLQGATEVGQLLLLVVFFASLPYCTHSHGHVYMELLHGRFTGKTRLAADALAALAGLTFSVAFSWQAALNAIDMFKFSEGAEMIELPYWPFALVLLASGILMTLAFALQLLRTVLGMPVNREGIET